MEINILDIFNNLIYYALMNRIHILISQLYLNHSLFFYFINININVNKYQKNLI